MPIDSFGMYPQGNPRNPITERPGDAPQRSYYDMSEPARPGYQDIWNEHMQMQPFAQEQLSGMKGFNQFQNEAMRSGPSAWAQQAGSQQDLLAKRAMNQGALASRGAAAQAASQLAMRGGVTAGARERLAKQGQRDYMNMAQDIRGGDAMNRMQIGMNDETNRVGQLGQLTGLENQRASLLGQARQMDVGNQMTNQQGKNAFNMDQYSEQMKAWGANQTANAQLGLDRNGKKVDGK